MRGAVVNRQKYAIERWSGVNLPRSGTFGVMIISSRRWREGSLPGNIFVNLPHETRKTSWITERFRNGR